MKRLNLAGKKIGKLTIIGYSHSHIQPSGQKRAIWDVICECGVKKKISTSTLSGSTISCGCYLKQIRSNGLNKKEPGMANLNYKYLSYRARAKKNKIFFNLSKEEFKKIVDKNCYYCDKEPEMSHTHRSYNGLYISNGIDRIDSKKGYERNNIRPCCKICNMMKNSLSEKKFLSHIKQIYVSTQKRQVKKNSE